MTFQRLCTPFTLLLALSPLLACSDDGPGTEEDSASSEETTGDGDGDASGDGDGDASGDGDGDGDASGDGDGDASGDGDGDASGDGDGDASGDGDGDASGDGDGDGSELPPDFIDSLTEVSSCGDIFIGVTNPEATIALFFTAPALVEQAHDQGETVMVSLELPTDGYSLRLLVGSDLDETCTDVGPGPTIDAEWSATAGGLQLTVEPFGEPEPWEMPAYATLELSEVTLEGPDLETVQLDSFSVIEAYVGWLPG